MSALASQVYKISHADYFDLEQRSDQRHEYWAGDLFAMAGGSESHALISANTVAALVYTLRDLPCRVYGADMKLRIAAHDKFCYPDAMVLCEQGKRHSQFVENPSLIVEVLSASTETYDRGLKFEHYRSILGFHDYMLLDQTRMHAEWFQRSADGSWRFNEASGIDGVIYLEGWDKTLYLAELYRQVEFELTTSPFKAS